jgi:CRP-like cAMP-binding protein
MIPIELLRRYPFFALLTDDQLKAIAMVAEEKTYPKETLLVKENTPATKLILLLEGDVDLIYSGGGEGAITNALVGSIAPGEMLGVSSIIEPFIYISSARATVPAKVVEIDPGFFHRSWISISATGCLLRRILYERKKSLARRKK